MNCGTGPALISVLENTMSLSSLKVVQYFFTFKK